VGNVAALVAALFRGDLALLGRAIDDRLVVPLRASLIPGFPAVQQAALGAGALGCSISGAGPSVFALAGANGSTRRIGDAMRAAFRAAGLECDLFVGPVNTAGAAVLDRAAGWGRA
jgi:homoserine kinase